MQPSDHANTPNPDGFAALRERKCLLREIELISYSDALDLQMRLHAQVADGGIPGVLLLLEHKPVITMGVKRTSAGNVVASAQTLQKLGVELVTTDRGGDVTYHGPGQLVGYPIVGIRDYGGDLHTYLRMLEETVIRAISCFGIEGRRIGDAGVWVGEKKICSIGIAVRRMVTYHGFALNVDPDLSHFALINPCGIDSSRITSLSELLDPTPRAEEVRAACASSFAEVFDVALEPWSKQ